MHPSNEDHVNSVVSRYDEFQSEAVANLLADYGEKKNGRFLLVIPTGGGKTYTAVKAINEMYAAGILDKEKDRVVWGAHRNELVIQAKNTFLEYAKTEPDKDYSEYVFVGMMSEVLEHVKENTESVCIAVIDEAHHAIIKNITYGPLFHYPNLGILGLTATPSRHDGEPLDFEKESYSIGFPDMVERQLILSPYIHRVEGGRYEEIYARGAVGFEGLENLDCPERDKKIIGQLLDGNGIYNKVIIYAATRAHVKSLHQRIACSELASMYDSIDYILGGNEFSGHDTDRDEFIERIKGYKRSIIINCDVLTEGYDDPTVNTVVMASPTRSKLVYMQAMGRCIRVNKEDPFKKAFIVEVVDDLPNIRYRINNRWLFSEISDALEPHVIDRAFSSAKEFSDQLAEVLNEYNANVEDFVIPEWDKSMRYSLLLFRSYIGDGKYRHLPILIDGRNRAAVSNWYNILSERMVSFSKNSFNFEAAMKIARAENIECLKAEMDRQLIYESMEEAYKATTIPMETDSNPEPWITFVSFRFKSMSISSELLAFLEDVVNKEQMAELIKNRSFRKGDYLIKIPLPLGSCIGIILSGVEFDLLAELMGRLKALKDELSDQDHLNRVDDVLKSTVLPIQTKYLFSLPTIVRENISYFAKLE